MQNLAYTKSTELIQELQKIDDLRKDLLLIPLSPKDEIGLQWDAQLNLIHYLLAFGGIMVEHSHIKNYLSPLGLKQEHPHQALIESYKRAYDYLYHHWLVSPAPVTAEALYDYYQATYRTAPPFVDDDLSTRLKYIQVSAEHPVIQASLALIHIVTAASFGEYSQQFAQLVFLLFLYKFGYDLRRMPVYAGFFYRNIVAFKDIVAQTTRQQNVTWWLEYAAHAAAEEIQRTIMQVKSPRQENPADKQLLELNERQIAIISLFNQPDVKISNRTVQQQFNVSQITASRDLAKLTALGVIFPVGKGRSTYYTKV